jgi:hypothetical protein
MTEHLGKIPLTITVSLLVDTEDWMKAYSIAEDQVAADIQTYYDDAQVIDAWRENKAFGPIAEVITAVAVVDGRG